MKKLILTLTLILALSSCGVKLEVAENNEVTSTGTLVESSGSITQTGVTSTGETNTGVVTSTGSEISTGTIIEENTNNNLSTFKIITKESVNQDFTSVFAKKLRVRDLVNGFDFTISTTKYTEEYFKDDSIKIAYKKVGGHYVILCDGDKQETKKTCKTRETENSKVEDGTNDIFIQKHDGKLVDMFGFEDNENNGIYRAGGNWVSNDHYNINNNSVLLQNFGQDGFKLFSLDISIIGVSQGQKRIDLSLENLGNRSYKIIGKLNSNDCKSIDVFEQGRGIGAKPYILKKYKQGDSSFEFNISPKYENIGEIWSLNNYYFRCNLGNNIFNGYSFSFIDRPENKLTSFKGLKLSNNDYGYSEDDKKIYYSDCNYTDKKCRQELKGVNKNTFNLVEGFVGYNFAYDDKSVFLGGQKVEGADPLTFDQGNKNSMFYFDKNNYYTRQGKKVDGINPNSNYFGYSRNSSILEIGSYLISFNFGDDYKTAYFVDQNTGKTTKILVGHDFKEEFSSEYDASDSKNKYFEGKIVK